MSFTDEELAYLAYNPEAATSTQLLARELIDLKANPRDEFHTMTELYEQRMLWHAMAMRFLDDEIHGQVCKSWRHSDGEPCFGITAPGERWFIVTMTLPDGKQVSQHYPEKDWGLFQITATPVAPHWDGHTPADGNDRLISFLKGI